MKEFLRCLLLPIKHQTLLVPYSAVAEIVEIELKAVGDKKFGSISWRGIEVSLIDLDQDERLEKTGRMNVAILNRGSDTGSVDFVGLVLKGLPTMNRYKRSDIEWISKATEPYGLMNVRVRTQTVLIPSLDISRGFGFAGG